MRILLLHPHLAGMEGSLAVLPLATALGQLGVTARAEEKVDWATLADSYDVLHVYLSYAAQDPELAARLETARQQGVRIVVDYDYEFPADKGITYHHERILRKAHAIRTYPRHSSTFAREHNIFQRNVESADVLLTGTPHTKPITEARWLLPRESQVSRLWLKTLKPFNVLPLEQGAELLDVVDMKPLVVADPKALRALRESRQPDNLRTALKLMANPLSIQRLPANLNYTGRPHRLAASPLLPALEELTLAPIARNQWSRPNALVPHTLVFTEDGENQGSLTGVLSKWAYAQGASPLGGSHLNVTSTNLETKPKNRAKQIEHTLSHNLLVRPYTRSMQQVAMELLDHLYAQ